MGHALVSFYFTTKTLLILAALLMATINVFVVLDYPFAVIYDASADTWSLTKCLVNSCSLLVRASNTLFAVIVLLHETGCKSFKFLHGWLPKGLLFMYIGAASATSCEDVKLPQFMTAVVSSIGHEAITDQAVVLWAGLAFFVVGKIFATMSVFGLRDNVENGTVHFKKENGGSHPCSPTGVFKCCCCCCLSCKNRKQEKTKETGHVRLQSDSGLNQERDVGSMMDAAGEGWTASTTKPEP